MLCEDGLFPPFNTTVGRGVGEGAREAQAVAPRRIETLNRILVIMRRP
jgi:hypothetical protein